MDNTTLESSTIPIVPVVYQGSVEDADLQDAVRVDSSHIGYPHVWVSRFGPREWRTAPGGGSVVESGVLVQGRTGRGRIVCQEFVMGSDVYEPDSRNQGGGLGAYRPMPPGDDVIRGTLWRLKPPSRRVW